MIHAQVREEIAARLQGWQGLRASAWPMPQVQVPAIVVTLYPVNYDQTYGRGMDTLMGQLLLFVGPPNDRSSHERLDAYLSGAGDHSIKQRLETGEYSSFNTVKAVNADSDVATVAGKDLLVGLISIEISGSGA